MAFSRKRGIAWRIDIYFVENGLIMANGRLEALLHFQMGNLRENPPDSDPMWGKCVITHYVDPSTICQCTGMPDKNKKLVFEHDIVWDSDERAFYEIIWNQEDMCWNVKDADGYKSNFEECYGSTIEVNGNSFDNPELLEV